MVKSVFELALYIELNLFAFSILLVLLLFTRSKTNRLLFDQKLFITLIVSNAILLIFDTLMVVFDGMGGQGYRILLYISTFVYYIFNTLISMFWYMYIHYYIYRNKPALMKQLSYISIPFFIVCILTVLSLFGNYAFYIDSNNIYHRGRYFILITILSYLYIVFSYILLFIKRRSMKRKEFLTLLLFAIPAIIGGVIQVIIYGITLLWICTTLSLMIIYINIQNTQLYKDYLTDLYNRRQLDNYMRAKINNSNTRRIVGYMIDIDSFKKINDVYGHDIGDLALKITAQVLRDTFSQNDFIARYGGDEFVVITDINDGEDPYEYIDKINYNLTSLNSKKDLAFKIGLSIGCSIQVPGETLTDFFRRMDKMMYINKAKTR
ncbi:MAG: putative diguanylate cyclase YcdT [Firmicutes bacterium ADurb.Bin146]|nr:MAG: putative diguanylate cyclase YcdT [Firmicutes bacterium ADurb.Bin146]